MESTSNSEEEDQDPDPSMTIRITKELKCPHEIQFNKCTACQTKCENNVYKVSCIHRRTAYTCEKCYRFLVNEKNLPLFIYICKDLENLKKVREKNLSMLQTIYNDYASELPFEDLYSYLINKEKYQKGIDVKFKFSRYFKCQHNILISDCKNCLPTKIKDLNEIFKSKCLHRITIPECNHCRNLFFILKKEKEHTQADLITDRDYITLNDYYKLYPSTSIQKRNIPKSDTNKKKKIDNINQVKEITKPIVTTENTSPTKRNFNVLTSEELTKTELPEGKKKEENKKNINNNKINKDTVSNINQPEIITQNNPEQKNKKQNSKNINFMKPPPIYIINENIEPLKKILTEYGIKENVFKQAPNKQIKILIKSEDDYKETLKRLQNLEIKFYTFQPFNGKTTKRLIRGLPVDFGIENIKYKLEELINDLKIKNIRQIYHPTTKTPLPLFEINVKLQGKITETLENVKKLENFDIQIGKIDPKYIDIPICKTCLNYGHTKRYCFVGITCIICTGPHFSTVCPKSLIAKEKNSKITPTCLHCKEPHFSTWKGCKYYKKLRKAKLEKLKKQTESSNNKNKEPNNDNSLNQNKESIEINNNNNKEIQTLKEQIKKLTAFYVEEFAYLNNRITSLLEEIYELKELKKIN